MINLEQYELDRRRQARIYINEYRQSRLNSTVRERKHLHYPDYTLLLCLICLMAIGLVMVHSSTLYLSLKMNRESTFFFHKQAAFYAIGLMLAYGLYHKITADSLEKGVRVIYLSALVMLIGTFLPFVGIGGKGAHRWINLGLLQFQVSEFVKFAVIVFTSYFLVQFQNFIERSPLHAVISLFAICGVYVVLLLLQPDLGSTVLIVGTMIVLLFLANVDGKLIGKMFAIGLAGALLLVHFTSYRQQRMASFLDPFAQAQGAGHQLVNSMVAIGANGMDGLGLGESIQKYSFLSEGHNDFIFAIIGEELGFWGLAGVLTLYSVIFYRCFAIAGSALKQRKPFVAYYAYGIGVMMMMQVLIHTGSVIGMIPTKGLTLPLISYGGSSLIMTLASFAILLRLSSELKWARLQQEEQNYLGGLNHEG